MLNETRRENRKRHYKNIIISILAIFAISTLFLIGTEKRTQKTVGNYLVPGIPVIDETSGLQLGYYVDCPPPCIATPTLTPGMYDCQCGGTIQGGGGGVGGGSGGTKCKDKPHYGETCTKGKGVCEREGTYVCDDPNSIHESPHCDAVPREPEEETESNCTDGIDTDCDGYTDCDDKDCSPDDDGDGYNRATEFCPGSDCDDNDKNVHHGAAEECDNIDHDCDGNNYNGVEDDNCKEACEEDNYLWDPEKNSNNCCGDDENDINSTNEADCSLGDSDEGCCSDGIDNDCDGLVDCEDSNCNSCCDNSCDIGDYCRNLDSWCENQLKDYEKICKRAECRNGCFIKNKYGHESKCESVGGYKGLNATCADGYCKGCSNGIQDGNEEGIDCGGACPPCTP